MSLAILTAMGFQDTAAADSGPVVLNPGNDAGVLLNQEKQRLEQEKIAQRIAEGRTQGKVEGIEQRQQGKTEQSVSFVLQGIQMNPSSVLSEKELRSMAAPYIGKEVLVRDLYALVEDINQLYAHKGYLTCRALLYPQMIKDGVIQIELVEGKTGSVTVEGNKTTRQDYIRNRVHLTEGKVANITQLDKDLLRFGAANDVQLHLALRAGTKEGTTDYTIKTYEPALDTWGLFSDNLGNASSGLYRGGMFWKRRSLTGRRDPLMINTTFSKGLSAVTASYTRPINRAGTKLGLTYSTNRVRTIYGFMGAIDTTGYSRSLTFSLSHPVKTTETVRSEAGIEYQYQNAKTNTMIRPWLDNTVYSTKVYIDRINYGPAYVFYQKHSYQFGEYWDIYNAKGYFGKYMADLFFQKRYGKGRAFNFRFDGQFNSSHSIPSAEQFYIGGMYTVRGYKESLLGGQGGICGSLEYEVPVIPHSFTKAYVFFDAGRIWGDTQSIHSLSLAGTGLGIKSSIGQNVDANVCLAFPLTRMINYEEQSKTRIHFSITSRF